MQEARKPGSRKTSFKEILIKDFVGYSWFKAVKRPPFLPFKKSHFGGTGFHPSWHLLLCHSLRGQQY